MEQVKELKARHVQKKQTVEEARKAHAEAVKDERSLQDELLKLADDVILDDEDMQRS